MKSFDSISPNPEASQSLEDLQKSFADSYVAHALAKDKLDRLTGGLFGPMSDRTEAEKESISLAEAELEAARLKHKLDNNALRDGKGFEQQQADVETARVFILENIKQRISKDPVFLDNLAPRSPLRAFI